MRRLVLAVVVVPALIACGVGAPARGPTARTAAHRASSVPAGIADRSPPGRLPPGGSLENESDTDRQIRELRRADAQYQQFLDRARDDPRFREATQKSRDRQADIQATIEFLEAGRRAHPGD